MWFKTLVRKGKENVFAKPTGRFFEETDIPFFYPVTKKLKDFKEKNKHQYHFAYVNVKVETDRRRYKSSNSVSVKHKYWTKEETQILLDFYENPKKLLELLEGKTIKQIRRKCQLLNIPFSYQPVGSGNKKKEALQ